MPSRRPYPEALSRRQRLLAAAPAVLAHLAMLAALIISLPPPMVPADRAGGGPTLSYLELAAPPSPPQPPTPPVHEQPVEPPPAKAEPDPSAPKLIEHPEDLGLPAPRSDIAPLPVTDPAAPPSPAATLGPPAPSDPCQLVDTLQLALQADPRVQGALALIPRESRSVANAIMFWDGRWVAVNALGGEAGLEPIRAAIVQGLATASDACKGRLNSGPIFVAVDGPSGSTVLAVGSGPWRVADLIAEGPGTK